MKAFGKSLPNRQALALACRLRTLLLVEQHMFLLHRGQTMPMATPNVINIEAPSFDTLRDAPKCSAHDRAVEALAKGALENLPFIQSAPDCVKVRCRNSRLFLSGRLPSFYLKQLAQETLRQMDGNQMEIVNAIDVARYQEPFCAFNSAKP